MGWLSPVVEVFLNVSFVDDEFGFEFQNGSDFSKNVSDQHADSFVAASTVVQNGCLLLPLDLHRVASDKEATHSS